MPSPITPLKPFNPCIKCLEHETTIKELRVKIDNLSEKEEEMRWEIKQMKQHIEDQPDGKLYFEYLKDVRRKKTFRTND